MAETKDNFNGGIINLMHKGAYMARFTVSWEEYSQGSQGEEKSYRRDWTANGTNVKAGFSAKINLPVNARNIQIMAEAFMGGKEEDWRVFFEVKNLPLVKVREVLIYGTLRNQIVEMKP